jgi:integrase
MVRPVAHRGRQHKPQPKGKPRGLTVAELEGLTAAVRPESRLLSALLAHTGVRIGDALGLRWQHVHLGDDPHSDLREQVYRGERRRQPKSRYGVRSIPLSPDMAVALDRRRRAAEASASRYNAGR